MNFQMIIKVYARRGGVTRLQLLGPLTASIYTTQVYSNVLRDHMAGLPIPTLSPIENILALRSHMRGSIFQQHYVRFGGDGNISRDATPGEDVCAVGRGIGMLKIQETIALLQNRHPGTRKALSMW